MLLFNQNFRFRSWRVKESVNLVNGPINFPGIRAPYRPGPPIGPGPGVSTLMPKGIPSTVGQHGGIGEILTFLDH